MREPIRATEGHILTNGEIYGRTIYLAEGMDASTFYEMAEEEYEALLNSEEATEEDYQKALTDLGVEL